MLSGFLMQHWRGQSSLGQSFWLGGVVAVVASQGLGLLIRTRRAR